ncbi:MAG: DsbA family protein [Micavibrio sp.]
MKSMRTNGGNARIIVLIAIILAVAALAAYFFLGKTSGPLPQTEVTDEALLEDEAAMPAEESGDASGADAAQGPSSFDLAAAVAPRALGNPDAPIKIIEYASMTCSHCGHFHTNVFPALKSRYIDTGKVFFEFREFPLNDPALKATITARCLPVDKYEAFISVLFKTQGQWDGNLDYMKALRQNAKLAGLNDATFDACHDAPMLKLKIAENMQEAKDKWNINATPTFIINEGEEILSGARPIEEFERIFRKITDGAVGEAAPVE